MKDFFRHLNDILFPPPKRNTCPHCGGGRCYGMCSVTHEGSGQKDRENTRRPGEEQPPADPPESRGPSSGGA
ncbi:hypothetical protein KL86DPRO_10284 [uncultured delta proteobacterium]|uniref:Uncharacterized protein n=1 Tax=uncultured delta proteobacterium TaxID=34034 RepID=A0A212IXV5_9DELT|nr:hypothetical protein KL86DPRO_10284 [uncultured delta proteobacterium]